MTIKEHEKEAGKRGGDKRGSVEEKIEEEKKRQEGNKGKEEIRNNKGGDKGRMNKSKDVMKSKSAVKIRENRLSREKKEGIREKKRQMHQHTYYSINSHTAPTNLLLISLTYCTN